MSDAIDANRVRAGLRLVRRWDAVYALTWCGYGGALGLSAWVDGSLWWRWVFVGVVLLILVYFAIKTMRDRRSDVDRLAGPADALIVYYRGVLDAALRTSVDSQSYVVIATIISLLLLVSALTLFFSGEPHALARGLRMVPFWAAILIRPLYIRFVLKPALGPDQAAMALPTP